MLEHFVNTLDNFIIGLYHNDVTFCDDLIEFYENHEGKQKGVAGWNKAVNKDIKDSTDVYVHANEPLIHQYIFNHLTPAYEFYLKKYHSDEAPIPSNLTVFPKINIQHYKPGQGFKSFHSERSFRVLGEVTRQLVFMTYLNNVTENGETEFLYQKLKIKPEKGLTLIWPSDWMYTHRGIVSQTQDKYIITGWYNFIAPTKFGYPNWERNIWE